MTSKKRQKNAKIEDFGIVISSGISLESSEPNVAWIRGIGQAGGFYLDFESSPYPDRLYFRAWAKNAAGYALGPVKKVIVPQRQKLWWGKTRDLAGGWKQSEWFGLFNQDESGWLYHQEIGWLYSSAVKDGSVWLWNKPLGWVWTQQENWPHLWSNRSKGWLYFFEGRSGKPARFYDYSSKSYR